VVRVHSVGLLCTRQQEMQHTGWRIHKLGIIKVFFIHQLTYKQIVLKTIVKFALKLTLKQLRHVLVQSPSSGSALFELAKVTVVKGGKILSTPSFGREVKPWVPCRRFAACKRTLNVLWKSAFRQNYRSLYPPISSNFRR
jgi:hypothetical protein